MALNYKCPNCGGRMHFDAASGMMLCDYCDAKIPVSEVDEEQPGQESITEQDEQQETFSYDGQADESMSVTTYTCPSCGAQIMTDEQTAATFCSFCGNPTLIESRLCEERKPHRIVPFKQDKNAAMAAFKKWSGMGLLTPASFRSKATVEKIRGIYVPFWLYDCNVDCDLKVKATRVHRHRRGNTEEIITEHYMVHRDVTVNYHMVPADASEQMEDHVMDCLEPFRYEELVEFQKPYLAGFYAEKYTYGEQQLHDRIRQRVTNYAEKAAMDTIGAYSTKTKLSARHQIDWKKAEYVMLPVWLLNYQYNGKKYTFAMNGQTGRIVGNLPVSKGKTALLAVGTFLVSFIVICVIGGVLA